MKIKYLLLLILFIAFNVELKAQNTLDNVGLTSATPASVAYSLRQLSTSYTGPLVRVKVGASFYDVYPDASTKKFSLSSKISASGSTYNAGVAVASANALSTIISGSTDATVAIWYDQSGNGVHVLSNSATAKIITAGSILIMSGQPTIYFYDSNSFLTSSTTVNYSTQTNATVNAAAQDVASTNYISGILSTGNNGGWGLCYDPTSTIRGYWVDASGGNGAFSNENSTEPKVITGTIGTPASATSSVIYINSTLKGTKVAQNLSNGTTDKIYVGSRGNFAGRQFIGNISETIMFPKTLSASEQSTLESSQSIFLPIPISVIISSSASGAVCSGTSITFTATVTGLSSPTYQWTKNGIAIPGANASTYTTTTLSNNDVIKVWVNGGINNSNIVSNGLLLNLDASNPGSYSGTGNTWYDLSGNNNHGTLMNSPTYDAVSGSIVTNGTNQYISIPQVSTANTNITMQAWVYVNLNTTGTFIKNGTGGGGYSIGIGNWAYDQVGSNVVMLLYGRGWIGSGVSYATAGWKLVTLTLDGSSTAKAYVNGTLIGTYTWPTPTSPSGPLNLGANIGDGNIYYNGKFAAAYFYNRELSLAEIQQNYNAFATKTTAYSSNTITTTITTNNTASAASSTPTLCNNTALTNITHTTTGATGIGTATGLPAGVTATFASNTITISGTPTTTGTFNYTIPLTGGCGSVNATGTIIVNALDVLSPITAPVNVTVQAIGGGGGADGDWGASGGGGATAVKSLTLVAGDSVDITVGLGGISGIGWSGISGGNGGDSKAIFNSINIVAGGGKGPASGMAGGIATGGSINLKGGAGNAGGVKSPGFDGAKQDGYSAAGGGAGNYYDGLAPSYIYPGGLGGGLAGNGGHGSPQYPTGSNGESGFNYGGGGGGGGNYNGFGGAGGQGVVAITYSGTPIATGGTITQSGGFTTHTFSNPGSDTFTVQSANSAAVNMGLSLQLANATAGGTWSSLNTGIATISTTGLVTGVGVGTTTLAYSVTNSNGCTNLVSLSITVNPLNTSSVASSTPTLCINTALTNITHTTTEATGIGTATGLPAGVTAAFASNTITISGTPTVTGTFNYSIPLTGGFGTVNATGTITVNPIPTVSVTVSGDACINKTVLTATTGLSSYAWYKDNVLISGATGNTYTPTIAGAYQVQVSNGSCSITSTATTVYNCGITADGKMIPIVNSTTLVSTEGGKNFGTGLNELGSILNTTSLTTTTGTIGATTAVLGGVIAATNAITSSIGVFYSTDINFATYSIANIQSNVAAGTHTITISGLSSLTTYYTKSFITNKAGTSYGNVVSFTTTAPPPPAVGDSYGGGKVFYVFQLGDPGYVAGEYHGLIAATSDTQGYRVFGCRGWPAGTSAALGTGAANTTTLLGCSDTNFAAKLAIAVRDGGYSDWYLPSKDELNKLYLNKNIVGNFIDEKYWSSTEGAGWVGSTYYGDRSAEAFFQWFNNGTQSWDDKNAQKGIRAIRSF